MKTDAKTIQSACEAGLILTGVNEDKEPEWLGDNKQWETFNILMEK